MRRTEKKKRRALNIEIASELIDLVMDVADVAFNHLQDNQLAAGSDPVRQQQLSGTLIEEEHLIKKAQWRHWMDVIVSGKKVSEENLLIAEDDADAQKAAA